MECDPPVHVNHPHRQLQLHGGRKSAGTEVVARIGPHHGPPPGCRANQGLRLPMGARMRSPAVIESLLFSFVSFKRGPGAGLQRAGAASGLHGPPL